MFPSYTKKTMTKLIPSFLIAITLSLTSFGQNTRTKTGQIKNDPQTAEKAAKADAALIDKKNIADSTTFKTTTVKRKEKSCTIKRRKRSIAQSL